MNSRSHLGTSVLVGVMDDHMEDDDNEDDDDADDPEKRERYSGDLKAYKEVRRYSAPSRGDCGSGCVQTFSKSSKSRPTVGKQSPLFSSASSFPSILSPRPMPL